MNRKAKSSRSGPVEAMIRDPDGDIPIRRLDDILSQTSFSTIDYLNIDCGGLPDFKVLKSVTIEKYRPKIITIEALDEEPRLLIEELLEGQGLHAGGKLHYTSHLFCRKPRCDYFPSAASIALASVSEFGSTSDSKCARTLPSRLIRYLIEVPRHRSGRMWNLRR